MHVEGVGIRDWALDMDMITVSFDMLKKIEHLNHRRNNDLGPFGDHTCCDYVDSLHYRHYKIKPFGVTVFVEPCGNITKWGISWESVLDWWMRVFELQPKGWDYYHAGWHLDQVAENGLPEDPALVWQDR